jgi:hypothetical protein
MRRGDLSGSLNQQVNETTFVTGPNSFRLNRFGIGLHWSAPHARVMNLSPATPFGATPDAA